MQSRASQYLLLMEFFHFLKAFLVYQGGDAHCAEVRDVRSKALMSPAYCRNTEWSIFSMVAVLLFFGTLVGAMIDRYILIVSSR